ncbi:MAG: B3/4 domain-containing protein [Acutalibacteraceae bacterium]
MTTLDGNVRELTTDMLCIADGESRSRWRASGRRNSEITDKTAAVILESANFSRSSIRRTSRAVGLRTDASRRYEKAFRPARRCPQSTAPAS